jgi:hypothetical protein
MVGKSAASLKSALLASQGEASAAHVVTATPSSEELVKLSLNLALEEHLRLMQLDL